MPIYPIPGSKSGAQRDNEIHFKAEHVGLRTYGIAWEEDFNPEQCASIMGTGETASMGGGSEGKTSGGVDARRICEFNIPD